MAATSSSEIKFPIRRAPPVPKNKDSNVSKNALQDLMTLGNDPFSVAPMRSESNISYSRDRKKPPPRPPPPKINRNLINHKFQYGGLSILAGGRSSKTAVVRPQPAAPVATGTLIDLSSPSASPTLSKPALRQLVSPAESGFEDDFTPSGRSTPASGFSTPASGFSTPASGFTTPGSGSIPVSLPAGFVMPTIIRPAGWTPCPAKPPSHCPPPIHSTQPLLSSTHEGSPPPPNMPPPPPPPTVYILTRGPPIPPRPPQNSGQAAPHCIAEFDFAGETTEDLSFKVGDVIALEKEVNDEWLEGSIGGRRGMFPANHVRIVVPVGPGTRLEKPIIAVALYAYQPQSWDDLSFQEGDEIEVNRRINDDWLYGESNGRTGQFPANFVQDISDFLT